MAENDVTIQINVDAKDAQKAIDDFGRESVKVLQKTENQSDTFFNIFKSGALKFAGSVTAVIGGFTAIQSGISSAVEEAKLTRQIEASLLAVGDASKETVKSILQFASAIQQSTGISDDLVKSTFITAQNFGITTEKAKQLTKAAIDLAAATGTDVESAVRLLGGTLDGTVGKLGNYGFEFRNLTKAQLEAGDAIDLVSQKFGGTAAKDLDTFSGRLGELKNSFGDFFKEIGKIVTESPAVQEALKNTSEIINGVTESIKNQRKESDKSYLSSGPAIAYFGAYSGLAQYAAAQQKELNDQIEAFRDINVGGQSKAVSEGFAGIVEQAKGATASTSDFITRLNSLPQAKAPENLRLTGKALEETKKKAEEAAKAFESLKAKFGIVGTDEVAKIKARYEQERIEVENFSKKYVEYRSKAAQFIVNIEKNKADEIYKYNLEQAQKLNDEVRKNAADQKAFLQSVFENPFGDLGQRLQDQIVRAIEFVKNGVDIGSPFKEGEIAASISGGLNQILQGKEGAKKAISQVGELIGQSFGIPGLGAITELLSRGPEETKKFIKSFVEAVPDFITAVAESIPVVVEALVDTLINKGGIVKIAAALVKAMVFAPTLAKVGEAILGVPSKELTKGITDATQQSAKNWTQAFKDFFNNVGPAFGEAALNFGPALSATFDSLGKSLDESFNRFDDVFNKQFNLFISSFGNILSNFIGNIGPAFAQFFSDLGPAFEGAINNFVNAVTDQLSALFEPLTDSIQFLSGSFQALDTTFKGVGQIFTDFGNSIKSIFGGLYDVLKTLINSLNSLIKPLEDLKSTFGGGSGGGQGWIAEGAQAIGKVLGLSRGGVVYAADGLFKPQGADTVPAMLTPGEMVIPKDMVSALGSYLMQQNSSAPGSDTAMLSAIYAAVSGPIVVKTEAKVNQQAFADIILQLNRQNARLTA